jgi:hypothetical protein
LAGRVGKRFSLGGRLASATSQAKEGPVKKSKKLQFSKESVKVLDNPALNRAVGGFVITAAISCPNFDDCYRTQYDCVISNVAVCTTGGLSCLVVCDTP